MYLLFYVLGIIVVGGLVAFALMVYVIWIVFVFVFRLLRGDFRDGRPIRLRER